MRHEQLLEVSAMLSALTLLGIIALWGGKVFYPFWLICAVIHIYRTVGDYFEKRDDPITLIFLHFVLFTACSPFYLLVDVYRAVITAIEAFYALRRES